MPARSIEFGVVFGSVDGTRFVVAGRCLEDTIRLGDSFTRLYTSYFPDGPRDYATCHRTFVGELSQRVVSIRNYGHDFDELDPAMTAELVLEGAGPSAWLANHVLSNVEFVAPAN